MDWDKRYEEVYETIKELLFTIKSSKTLAFRIVEQEKLMLEQSEKDKVELLEALKLCKETIRRYANFNAPLMDKDDKARVKLFDGRLDQLLQKLQKQFMLSEAKEDIKTKGEPITDLLQNRPFTIETF